jgi:hypothetical protein
MRRILLAVMVAALGTAGVALSQSASAATTCTGEMEGAVPGPVIVPSGAVCDLEAVVVNGSVTVRPGGVLHVGSGSKIKGNVYSDRGGSSAPDTTPFGYSFSVLICNTNITGSVTVTRATDEVVIGDDEACGANRLDSSVNLNNNTSGVELINAPTPDACPIKPTYGACRIAGSVNLNGNTGETHDDPGFAVEVSDNVITGNGLHCTNNAGVLSDNGNTVTGGAKTGQCAGF